MVINNEKFAKARLRVLGENINTRGIGTLSERSMHKIIKYYIEPCEEYHEQKHCGYVCDIINQNGIYEIQTKGLRRLLPKLESMLGDEKITIIYPMVAKKTIHKIDTDGAYNGSKHSPKHQVPADAAYELYSIRQYLGHEKLTVALMFLDLDEYKMYGVRKRIAGKIRTSYRIECIPNCIEKIVVLRAPEDYLALLPSPIPAEFSSADIIKILGKRYKYPSSLLAILLELGMIENIGKVRNRKIYKKVAK